MSRKFLYLTKVSLKKKTNSKWFLITNIILAIAIIALMNINTIISFFGGDFIEDFTAIVIDNTETGSYDIFKENIDVLNESSEDSNKLFVEETTKTKEEVIESLDDDTCLIVLNQDDKSYLTAEIISNDKIDSLTYQMLTQGLNNTKSTLAMIANNIAPETLAEITSSVAIDRTVLNDDLSVDENMELIMSSVFPTLILPFFMLIIFLVQMVGGEVCEEKTTRSMEVIISNVSPKTHLLSKVVASNIFVIIQGLLLVLYAVIGFLISTKAVSSGIPIEFSSIFDSIAATGIVDKLIYVIPLTLILMILSFITYAVVAGILASMTVNIEDFNQLQTPIMLLTLAGYYLAIMAGMFEGSIFIRIVSYLPFLSAFVSPTLFLMGQISIIDILISIAVSVLFIYLLFKYGMKVYKAGILNYSNENIWKRFMKSFKS